ncbi:hypothetical protein Goshw_001111, partial [Gossypium schwendimanii]|nr:hypothetical protein [Gossypium schwendimanii]
VQLLVEYKGKEEGEIALFEEGKWGIKEKKGEIEFSEKMSGGGFRVSSIPSSVRKTIQNIKEITGNHSEDEIYAMLKECSMDPNETAQRLLLQGTFFSLYSPFRFLSS